MYVYGNGKWHEVSRVQEKGHSKQYIAACGQRYPGESNTSNDKAVLDSRYFCAKCLVLHRVTGRPD
jgi:predicted SprT family Zn-dependent metalloprotease